MGFFNNFPYTNFHDLNLDWILKSSRKAVDDSAKAVEIATESKDYITNYINSDDFKNAVGGAVQQFVDSGEIENIIADQFYPQLQVAEYSSFLTVGSAGCVCKTINEAISLVKTYPENKRNVGILIMPGAYHEEIVEQDLYGMGFFGIGKVNVEYNSVYPHAPVFCGGEGFFFNINFTALSSNYNSYAMHGEAQSYHNATKLTFINCTFISSGLSAVGIGTGENHEYTFESCMFISMNKAAFYCHNYPAAHNGTGVVRCNNCKLYNNSATASAITIDDSAKLAGVTEKHSYMAISFSNCVSGGTQTVLFNDGNTVKSGVYNSTNIAVDLSSRNTLAGVSVDNCLFQIHGFYPAASGNCVIGTTIGRTHKVDGFIVKNLATGETINGASILAIDGGQIIISGLGGATAVDVLLTMVPR